VIEKKLYNDFLADMELIREKITITDFAVDVLPTDIVTDLDTRIGSYKAEYSTLEQSKQVITKEYEKNKLNVQTSQQKVLELEKNI
jgi:esterase/lipase